MRDEIARRCRCGPVVATTETDETLLAAITRGEPAAFATLYGRFAGTLASLARHIVADRGEADDVTQEAFLRVWLNAGSYDPARGRASSWLLALARHAAIDQVRRDRRRPATFPVMGATDSLLGHLADPQVDVEREAWLAELRRLLAAAVAALPTAQRRVVELMYDRGLTQTEIAGRLGIPLGTVKSRQARGLRKLRAALEREGFGPGAAGPSSPRTTRRAVLAAHNRPAA